MQGKPVAAEAVPSLLGGPAPAPPPPATELALAPPPAVEGLRSAKWQERLEAMGSVLGKAEEAGEGLDASFLLQALGFLPGWGDKNFQVWVWGGVGGPFSVWMGGCKVRPQAWRWLCAIAARARACVCVTCGWVGRDGTRGRRHGAIDV